MGNSAHSRLSKEGGSEGSPRSLRHKSVSRRESSGEHTKRSKEVNPGVPAENGSETKVMTIESVAVTPERLTERQKELLIETWKELEENIARVGVIMYIGLFETHPDVQEVFMPFKGLELEELKHSKQLRSHALRKDTVPKSIQAHLTAGFTSSRQYWVMAFVQKAVARLHEPEKLDALLRELGKKHYSYSAKQEYVDLIGPQFIQAIKPSLEDKWTEEIQEAWSALFNYMSTVMKAEMDLEEKIAAANSANARVQQHHGTRSTTTSRAPSSGHNNPKAHGNRRASSDAAGGGSGGGGMMGNIRRGTLH